MLSRITKSSLWAHLPYPLPFLRNATRWFKIGKSPRKDEIFQVPIESLDKHGNGITTIEWDTIQKQIEPTTVVVRGALPGETVRVRVISVYSRGGSAIHTVRVNLFGRREHIIRPRIDSEPWRSSIEPELLPPGHEESRDYEPFDCPHFDRRHDEQACRGCSVPHLNYKRQITEKTKLLRESLRGAVDDELLAELKVEPRSAIKRFADKVEVFAFSHRPLKSPVWGQLSYKDPLPGERRNKFFVETPECRIMSKSAQAIIRRLGEIVAANHEESPGLFSVYDERLNRGYLRSTIVQSTRDREGRLQVLLSLVTAVEPSPRFREVIRGQVADRLIAEFPGILKGVNLLEARIDTDRDHEFFNDPLKVEVLAGEGRIATYIESVDREIWVGPETSLPDTEVANKLFSNISESVGPDPGPVLELYSGDGSMSGVLNELSDEVRSLGENEIRLLLDEGISPRESSVPLLTSDEPLDKPPIVKNLENTDVALPSDRDFTAVVSFPPTNLGKPEIKGVTPKAFRHWLGNVARPKRIVLCTDKFDGLRKDIGHMKLLGYELKSIKAFDSHPGVMNRIHTIVVLEKKPSYAPLSADQLIE
jgi:tRNA/tmRNA/rRNA uracil-C5-methylase (TrmA/RlmC/RlmD family)